MIPARGGSKGIAGKNIRSLGGKPLIQWTIESAIRAAVLDRLILSTDDEAIAEAGRAMGVEVPFRRPAALATDEASMIDVVTHALHQLEVSHYVPDAIAVLQPTSPLRTPQHIRRAIDLLRAADSVCSVVALPKQLSPHYVMRIGESGYLEHFLKDGSLYTRRQDVPAAYSREGTIYLVRRDVVLRDQDLYGRRCTPLLMDPHESLSIDGEDDWYEAEKRLADRGEISR